MKIRVIFKAKDKLFPLSYRMMITSLIKKSLELSDEQYFKDIYYYEEKKNKKIKPFTFAVFFNNYKIEKDEVQLNGNGSIIISTCDYNFGINVYNGLLKLKNYFYKKDKEYEISIEKILLEREKVINESRIFCKTLSPIHVKDKNNDPVDINSDDFNEELNYICDISLKTFRGYGLREKLYFTPVNMKKVIVKEKIEGFREINNKEYIYIEGYKGNFYLEGNIEDLRMLMQIGLGFRRSEGFGMIDLV